MTLRRRLACITAALVASVCARPAPGKAADAASLLYERSLMSAADARCKLFDAAIAGALASAGRQARGAALRAGADARALDAVEASARARAAATPCAAPDLAVAAGRVRAAFAGWSRLTTMSFPGRFASWRADRTAGRGGAPGWRLSQAARTPSGPVLFGLVGDGRGGVSLAAVAAWPGALAAATARLVMRDPAAAAEPYLDPRRADLSAQAAPRAVSRAFLASDREAAAPGVLPAGAPTGALFRFPAAATAAIEALDPREAVTLELAYPTRNGEQVQDVLLEVGDFAAARAFLAAGH